MSPVIRLPDSTFDRLKRIAEPFVDTPADVINKLLDEHEQRRDTRKFGSPSASENTTEVDSENPPNLKHTRVLDVQVNGNTARPKWNYLVRELHRVALDELGSFDKVQRVTQSNITQDHRDDSGFHYAEELGFSIQYVEANRAWTNALYLAKKVGAKVEVSFEWMNKEEAAHPGKRARLVWPSA